MYVQKYCTLLNHAHVNVRAALQPTNSQPLSSCRSRGSVDCDYYISSMSFTWQGNRKESKAEDIQTDLLMCSLYSSVHLIICRCIYRVALIRYMFMYIYEVASYSPAICLFVKNSFTDSCRNELARVICIFPTYMYKFISSIDLNFQKYFPHVPVKGKFLISNLYCLNIQ